MPTATVTKAWTDVEFRESLTIDELDRVPDHPAGDLEKELRQLTSHQATGQSTACTQWTQWPWCCC